MRQQITYTTAISLVSVPIGIALSVVLARVLLPAGRGEVAIFQASAVIVVLISSVGIPAASSYFLSTRKASVLELVQLSLVFYFCFCIIATIGFVTVEADFVEAFVGRRGVAIYLVFLGTVFSATASSLTVAVLRSFEQHRLGGILTLLSLVLQFLIALVLLARTDLRGEHAVVPFLAAKLLGDLFIVAIGTGRASRIVRRGFNPHGVVIVWRSREQCGSKVNLLEILQYGAKSTVADVIQATSYRLDIFVCLYFLGVGSVGIYTLAVGLLQYSWILPTTIIGVLAPSLAAQKYQFDSLRLWAGVSFVCVLCAVCAAVLVAPELIPLLYGDEFSAAATAMLGLAPGIIIFSVAKVYAGYVAANNELSSNLYGAIFGLVAGLVVHVLIVPRYGILGLGLGTSAGYVVNTLWVLRSVRRLTGVPITRMIAFDLRILKQLFRKSTL